VVPAKPAAANPRHLTIWRQSVCPAYGFRGVLSSHT